jgi:hypothetical protein
MENEVLEVLREIRDEAKATNARLDQTNSRLETVESRLQFVEKRLTNGFSELSEKVDRMAREQAGGFVTVEGLLTKVHAAIVQNVTLLDHERRLTAIEKQRG